MRLDGVYHVPALLKETVDCLEVKPGKKYIDATLGGGGHSEEILKRGGELLAIDRDPDAIFYATARLSACPTPSHFKVVRGNFARLGQIARENDFIPVEGILFDLGVSSHQLETASRGFSFNLPGPLDMRMEPELALSAQDLINVLSEKELTELFWKLGEERFARRIARAICRARQIKRIATSDELAEIVVRSVPPRGKFDRTHPATRIFQALRIAVNDELNSLREALPQATEILSSGGRLAVLSFHSLEDGIVKRFFLEKEKEGILKIITKRPIEPGTAEVEANPRARSAKLRVAQKK